MKVQVNMKLPASKESTKLDLEVAETDTVANLKDRIAALQLIPFPAQDLLLNGEVLADARQLSDCGVKELASQSLDFVVKADESTLVKQLQELLQARDLSCDELGLLYAYKHGVSVSQALATLDLAGEKLQDFVKKHKGFQLEKNHIALVRKDTALKPFSAAEEIESILKASGTGSMEIKELLSKFIAKFNISLASVVGMKPNDFFTKERERFVLKTVAEKKVVMLRSHSPGATAQTKPGQTWQQQPQQQQQFQRPSVQPARGQPAYGVAAPPPGLVGEAAGSIAADEAAKSLGSAESQQYLDLHNRICSRSFGMKAQEALSDVVDAVQEIAFLNVNRIVKAGSVGKGTAISGAAEAEVVFFLAGLPGTKQDRWLPPLLRAVAGVLNERLNEEEGVDSIVATQDSVQLLVKGPLTVDLRFSPVFGSYEKTLEALAAQGPEARHFFAASLAEERVQFICRQPSAVKVTIRLLKWWRDQQGWSSKLARPGDDILELMAVYSAVQTKPQDQRTAIANVMSLLSRFKELRIVWSNYYTKADVWAPLLRQRPLLMDPVNPYVNIADSQVFEPRELMDLARTTHFFW
mmetsp:Transcript_8520/g.21398  ORF Transcript_8520/g.21398 Transcript_8520/m.21398 type:complete len:581 (+) Transcript_8520:147-1889(+)